MPQPQAPGHLSANAPSPPGESAATLIKAAGDDEVKVTVTQRGAFEVHADRIERAPTSKMRVADLVAIYASKLEFNTTFFSRCAAASARVRSATLLQRPRAERLHAQASPAVVDAVAALDSDATTVDGAAAAR